MHDKAIEAMARALWGEDLGAGNADEVVSDGKANWQLCVTEATAALTALCTLHPSVAAILSGEAVAVPRKLLNEAHACMRETGWQLAPMAQHHGSDGVLEAACHEIEQQFAQLIAQETNDDR